MIRSLWIVVLSMRLRDLASSDMEHFLWTVSTLAWGGHAAVSALHREWV